jgi:hypothetical protein
MAAQSDPARPPEQTYVIFPSGAFGQALYYAWRPLSYADSALTGIHFHVGPHRE